MVHNQQIQSTAGEESLVRVPRFAGPWDGFCYPAPWVREAKGVGRKVAPFFPSAKHHHFTYETAMMVRQRRLFMLKQNCTAKLFCSTHAEPRARRHYLSPNRVRRVAKFRSRRKGRHAKCFFLRLHKQKQANLPRPARRGSLQMRDMTLGQKIKAIFLCCHKKVNQAPWLRLWASGRIMGNFRGCQAAINSCNTPSTLGELMVNVHHLAHRYTQETPRGNLTLANVLYKLCS